MALDKKKTTEHPNEKVVKASPHVHRVSSYITDLKKHWAYVDTTKVPRWKCADGSV